MTATPSFSSKLDALPSTLDLFRSYQPSDLASSLSAGKRRHALSIGSGGSAIAAEYLARCRDSLGLGPTTVQTPMQVVLDAHDLSESEVWLFSAGGDNPDVIAAALAARDRNAAALHIVTRNPDGQAVQIVRLAHGHIHVVPVADVKDGYLATHSLVASVTALLLASDQIAGDRIGRPHILEALVSQLVMMRGTETQAAARELMGSLSKQHTVIVASDPLLRPLAVLLDTSIWEASLCHVQTADFRNLAHGRHAWMHHRANETVILALTTIESRETWSAIESVLPTSPHRLALDHGTGGRLDNALAIIDGLGIIEAIGAVVDIDPGKPGIGDFGKLVYEDRSLTLAANAMSPAVRHKRSAIAKADSGSHSTTPLHAVLANRNAVLSAAQIGAIVFDYDGTLVNTDQRWSPPHESIISELVRLHDAGVRIGIATGRGGSAGEDLRKVLPPDMVRSMLIGYYNGGHVVTADVDIDTRPPERDPAIAEAAEWLQVRSDLFTTAKFKDQNVQLIVDMENLANRYRFPVDLEQCPGFTDGRLRLVASGHSYDIVPVGSNKLHVVEQLTAEISPGKEILCLGDSGAVNGNDHSLLSHPFGVSVGEICDAPEGCWSLFGSRFQGPAALLKILTALVGSKSEGIRFDIESLGLDSRQ